MELNESGDFAKIAESYDLGKSADHFVKDGIDYYPAANTDTMLSLGTRAYNFIVVDYGTYNRCDLDSYQHCSYKFIFSGIKPWEELNIQSVFEMGQAAGADLAEYHYFLIFARMMLRQMSELEWRSLTRFTFVRCIRIPLAAIPFHLQMKYLLIYCQ